MKKVSLLSVLTLSTMLSACGGGGGGGYGNIPNTTIPDIVNPSAPGTNTPREDANNSDLTMMKTRVVKDKDGSFANLVNNTLVSAYQEHDANSSVYRFNRFEARAVDNSYMNNTNICKSARDCNQEIFENMKKILIDKDLVNASAKELRDALILAGFKDELAGMWDDVKELQKYIQEHPEEIKERTDEIYNNHTTTIENAKFSFVEDDGDNQDSFVKFILDENKSIKGIHINTDSESFESSTFSLVRQGDENKFVEAKDLYVYGLRIGTDCSKGACAPNQGHELGFESEKELQPDEIRSRLLALFEEKYKEGAFEQLHGGTNNGAYIEGDDERFYNYAVQFIKDLSDEDLKNKDMDDITYDHSYSSKIEFKVISDYQSAAKDLKLAYSDFGLMTLTTSEKYEVRDEAEEKISTRVFAGGYEDKRLTNDDLERINGELTFKGKAIGGVNLKEEDNWTNSKNVISDTLSLTSDKQDNVTLTFNNGQQNLVAEFNNWYDIEVTKDLGDNATIKFTGGEQIQGTDKSTAEQFKFRGQNNYTVNNFIGDQVILADGDEHIVPNDHNNVTGNSIGSVDIGYYGDAGNPSEATGYIMYGESIPLKGENGGYERHKELTVQLGFGAKRQ